MRARHNFRPFGLVGAITARMAAVLGHVGTGLNSVDRCGVRPSAPFTYHAKLFECEFLPRGPMVGVDVVSPCLAINPR